MAALDAIPARPEGVLAPYERAVRARALLAVDRPAEVAAALAGVELPGLAGREAQLLAAHAAWKAGSLEGRARLEQLERDTVVGREATWWLAEGLPPGDARPLLQELWVDARPGGWDALAGARLAADGAPVADLSTVDARRLALARFESLKSVSRNEEALDLLVAVRAAGGTLAPTTWARAWSAARKWPEAVDAWKSALGPPDSAEGAAADLFDYALTTARSGDFDTAAVIYRRLIALAPTTDEADFASFKLGYMAYDRGDCDAAVPLLLAHAKERPTSKRANDARWFAARCQWRSGRVDAAVELWSALVETAPNSELAPGAAYWIARAAGRTDATRERARLADVLARWPVSGWAWFAAERLDRRFPTRPTADPPPWPDPPGAVVRARALLDQGFQGWARDELVGIVPAGREQALALAWLRASAGDYAGARQAARQYCVPPWKNGDPAAQQACTPRPERAVVESVAARGGMDPNLAYAIMTAESNLDPGVTSVAGARGLMQMMPDLGAALHRRLFPDREYHPDDLYNAPYNAALGTLELTDRTADFSDALRPQGLPAVIASYNGGADAVRRWTSGNTPEFDEFAEDIGYTETRLYVRRVLGFLMAYRWVYGDPPSP